LRSRAPPPTLPVLPAPSIGSSSAFFQPAIGRAFLEGSRDLAVAINQDVYGGPLFLTAGPSVLLFIAEGILGIAATRTRLGPRWAGYTFAASVTVFAIGNFVVVPLVQPPAGLGIAWARTAFAVRAQRSAAPRVDLQSGERRT
jgi:hypothetical protein